MRLFVGLDLPASILEALTEVGPPSARGVRLVPADQMHVTLHFIGDANESDVRRALGSVVCEPCRVSVCGVGRFRLNGGKTILWAGVVATEELLELHAECGRALEATGIRTERRPYKPHVTLARLKPNARASAVEAFLRVGEERDFGSFLAKSFILYNSVTRKDGPAYEVVASFPIKPFLTKNQQE